MKCQLTFCLLAALVMSLTACSSAYSPSNAGNTSVSDQDEIPSISDLLQEEHGVGPAVEVEYPPDDIPKEMIAFADTHTEFDQPVLFRAQTDVANLCFFVVDYPADGGLEMEGEALFTCDSMAKGDEIVLITSFPGDTPSRGISFDLSGQHEAYTLSMSGEDGSLILTPIGGVVAGW